MVVVVVLKVVVYVKACVKYNNKKKVEFVRACAAGRRVS